MKNEMNIRQKIIKCIEENGIQISSDGNLDELESIKFISLIVSLEEEFKIEFPEEYLLTYKLSNVDMIKEVIINLIDNRN